MEAVARNAHRSFHDLITPQQFFLRCSAAQWATLLGRAFDDASGPNESLALLSPHVATSLKQTEKKLRGFMPILVQKAFDLFCDGIMAVLRWTPHLEHTVPVVAAVKARFAVTYRAWPPTPLGGPALLGFAEQTRATLITFLKTKAGTPAEMAFATCMYEAIEQDGAHCLSVVKAVEAGGKGKDKPHAWDAADQHARKDVPAALKEDKDGKDKKARLHGKRDPTGVLYSRDNPNKVDACPHPANDCGLHRKFLQSKGPACWVGTR
jgi:hypothetical protein